MRFSHVAKSASVNEYDQYDPVLSPLAEVWVLGIPRGDPCP